MAVIMLRASTAVLILTSLPLGAAASEAPAAAAAASYGNALAADDECAAGGGSGSCGLNALQLRSHKQALPGEVALASDSQPDVGKASGNPDALVELDAAGIHASNESLPLGTVSAIYTFGAPSTSHPAFTDLARPDGVFQGLRCYTENIFGVADESRQVDGGAIFGTYEHPKVAMAALHWQRDSSYVPGAGQPEEPKQKALVYADWGLHREHHYQDRLAHITLHGQSHVSRMPFAQAKLFATLAFGAYSEPTEMREKIRMHLPGWRLVNHATQNTLEALDTVWIVQQESSKDCAIVFEGTSGPSELSTSITQYATGYCGYPRVHVGYRNKLWWITQGIMPQLRPTLARCNRVTCTGHSLGGSLCDIFSACANSRRTGDPDFQQQMWTKETPQLMPAV